MAFPSVLSVSQQAFTTASPSHTVNYPAAVDAGDLLVLLIQQDDDDTFTISDFTLIGEVSNTSGRLCCYARKATGSEGSGTFTVGISASEEINLQLWRIDAGTWADTGTLTNDVAVSGGTFTNSAIDPPSLAPGWGSLDILWIAVAGSSGSMDTEAAPSSYSTYLEDEGGGVVGIATGRRELNSSSDDPGSFTMTNTGGTHYGLTVAIRPNENVSVTPGTASLSTARFAPTLGTGAVLEPGVASLAVAPQPPATLNNSTQKPGTSSLASALFTPVTVNDVAAAPATVAIATSTFVPVVVADNTVTPAPASLSIAAFSARVALAVEPGTGILASSLFPPVVLNDAVQAPGAASLGLSPFAPIAIAGYLARPGLAAMVTAQFAPSVLNIVVSRPAAAALTASPLTPTVEIIVRYIPGMASLTISFTGVALSDGRPLPSGRRLRVDVYDASGAKLDFGAITNVLEFEYSLKLDEIGAFRMALPADDPAVGELDQGYELRCYREGEGLVFRGLIDAIAWGEDGSRRTAEVTGSSIARKLVFANTLLGLAFEGDTLADVVSTLLTGTGWSAGALDVPSTTLLARYDGASAWEALNHASRVFGLHVREDNLNAEVDIGAFGSASGVTLQNVPGAVMARFSENTDLFPLVSVQVLEESQDLWNRVIPLGAGEGVNQLTLRYSTRSSPYTIESDTGPDGQTYYYLEDAAGVAAIGARTKVLFAKDAIPLANSAAGFEAAANALYDVAATWLARHSETRASYSVETAGLTHLVGGAPRFQVGEKMRLNYRGAVQDADGTKRLFKTIGADCWLIGFSRSFESTGADRWQLELSTVDRSGEGDAERLGEVYQAMHALQVSLRNYTFQAPYILGRSSLNASNTAQLTVKLDANISLLHLAKLTWTVRALRSNVTAAASGGSSTPTSSSGGSSTPTTSSGGSSTPTSSAAGSHRHQMFDYVSVDSSQLIADAFYDSDAQTAYIATGSAGVDHTHGLSEMQGHTHNVTWDSAFGVGLASVKSKSAAAADLTHSFLMVNQINQDIYTWEAAADHSHTVTIAAHTHSVAIAAHTHTVTISPHTHGMTYGIYNDSTPSNPAITVTINGVDRTSALGGPWNTVNAEVTVDITAYLQDGATEIPLQQSNTIVFGASVLCDIEAICRIDMTRSALIPV